MHQEGARFEPVRLIKINIKSQHTLCASGGCVKTILCIRVRIMGVHQDGFGRIKGVHQDVFGRQEGASRLMCVKGVH